MQLKHIKLAGFKSFVDPTRISFPTNLVAVVGPNGCGKSNVIDAVKWVLGELSAKNLRGDSMSDVIFNGSDLRKPSGQCSIELLFDNSSGKLGGEYAAYNEISIKRLMTRDSQSTYFINSTKCRRKDVQDLFLGTGLGPNSYAIIEQGMVSNLVSAKPEELRVHIEEAAGVSKYRERRKETEQRIKKTKENLSRVKDIKDEISRLIRRLEGQANAAEKYNQLKAEEKENELKVAILFSLEAKNNRDALQKKLDVTLRDQTIKDAEANTKQSQIDKYRTEHESVRASYDEAQKNFYAVGADIARQEADLQNETKTLIQSKSDIERAKESYAKAIEKESTFENLTPKEKELKLNISILKALEALDKKAELNLKISPLELGIAEKTAELDLQQSRLTEVKESYASVASGFEAARSSASSISSNIAMHEADLRNINKIEVQSKIDLEKAKKSYANALEEEANIDNLSPKEKAINLLDMIIDTLKAMGSGSDGVYQKAIELKDQLTQILNIASAQSKSLTDEYLNRQNSLSELLKDNAEKKSITERELGELVQSKSTIEIELEEFRGKRTQADDLIREMENKRSVAAADLRTLEAQINALKLELRTFEVNLENASHALTKEGINPAELNSSEFKDMNLLELEGSLEKIQESISALGSINLASPDEYLTRQNDLSKIITETESKKQKLEQSIAELVQKSSSAEGVLVNIRQEQSKVDQELRDLENKRSIAELDLRAISEKVTNIKLELKTYEINLENANARIKKSGINIEDINYEDYEDFVIKDIEDQLTDIQAKIIRLGAINLAAPDEIAEESIRGKKLEEQYNELTEALDKLTGAIKKIDVETKSRFKDSFDAVNNRLKEVFPILFGGGFAELTLQDDDALNGGVVLMARPPGKKNASISQLSGGEKALTALSLVFSIFELNPAPFCMLDEVDAPLDDLNTQRLINMVEEMSKTIQFIFITHNKVSMERSDHLMGITMQEAGVSRLVTVDVNQALELANTD
jgi:chromosome segregation protein|tara:strand:+ start:1755 stop:4745 length:2991 start_codon:yes stop_codon:yes gene_type:complete